MVGNVRAQALNIQARPAYYYPNEQAVQDFAYMTRFMALTIRTTGEPMLVASSVRATIRAAAPTLPLVGLQSMNDVVHGSMARSRFVMTLLGIFAGVALVLGAVGIYGVMAYGVAQRTGEIGIRMALGAGAAQVTRMVVGQGMLVALVGVGVGVVGAIGLTRFMESQLFGVSATDPITFAAVAALLSVVALVASYLPARRAAKVDPIEALRAE